ncbi:TPA: hypothetical protein ACLGPA_005006, partial [Salmonella enterica]
LENIQNVSILILPPRPAQTQIIKRSNDSRFIKEFILPFVNFLDCAIQVGSYASSGTATIT